jgi:RNA polymerase sigma-70 factor (ECF subfamily)
LASELHYATRSTDITLQAEQERVWVEGLRNKEADSYVRLVRTYAGPLLRTARRYVDEDDARDTVQEVFGKVAESIGTFRGDSSLSTWLHRIVINLCISRLRTRTRRKEVCIDELLPTFVDDGHRAEPSPPWPESLEHVVQRETLCQLVTQNIEKLPANYRTVLMLRDIEGLSSKETAEVLGISVGSVKVRLHRARQALREMLDPIIQGASA